MTTSAPTAPDRTPPAPTPAPGQPARWAAMVCGVAGGGVALGMTEWWSGLARGVPSLIGAVGQTAIDWSPGGLVHLGIRLLGHHDKTFVVGVVLALCAAAAAWLGVAGARRRGVLRLGFVAFAAVGSFAASRDPQADVVQVVVAALVCAAVGLAVTELLLWTAPRRAPAGRTAEPGTDAEGEVLAPPPGPVPSAGPDGRRPAADGTGGRIGRRGFFALAGGAGVAALAFAASGRRLVRQAAVATRRHLSLPAVEVPVAAPTAVNSVGVAGVTPIVVPAADFYRIDTRLLGPPTVDVDTWRLKITGKVDRPQILTWDQLSAMAMVEEYVTLQCVSNEVGGDLVGNAAWRGVRLSDLLGAVGVHPDADQIVGRSVDGFTAGFPTTAAFDGRHAMVAIGMNGDLLPLDHGFPARLIVAGLYGYVSGTKWLSEIELTRFDAYDTYWVRRGWDRLGPILTQSRIDAIAPNPPVAGTCVLAGEAWAPTRGISKVELQVDTGPWAPAQLAAALSTDTWVQWSYRWEATPGRHLIRVRATDGDGKTQSSVAAEPQPGPATGYHTVGVTIPG